jgi:hypothetical protein
MAGLPPGRPGQSGEHLIEVQAGPRFKFYIHLHDNILYIKFGIVNR